MPVSSRALQYSIPLSREQKGKFNQKKWGLLKIKMGEHPRMLRMRTVCYGYHYYSWVSNQGLYSCVIFITWQRRSFGNGSVLNDRMSKKSPVPMAARLAEGWNTKESQMNKQAYRIRMLKIAVPAPKGAEAGEPSFPAESSHPAVLSQGRG